MQKKTYVRPQLVKHGNVETLTQGTIGKTYGGQSDCLMD